MLSDAESTRRAFIHSNAHVWLWYQSVADAPGKSMLCALFSLHTIMDLLRNIWLKPNLMWHRFSAHADCFALLRFSRCK